MQSRPRCVVLSKPIQPANGNRSLASETISSQFRTCQQKNKGQQLPEKPRLDPSWQQRALDRTRSQLHSEIRETWAMRVRERRLDALKPIKSRRSKAIRDRSSRPGCRLFDFILAKKQMKSTTGNRTIPRPQFKAFPTGAHLDTASSPNDPGAAGLERNPSARPHSAAGRPPGLTTSARRPARDHPYFCGAIPLPSVIT